MADVWYYAHDANRIGPFSALQLKNLATVGDILRTDTVWKEGVEKGVLASKVRYLFSIPAAIVIIPVQRVTALSKPPASTPAAVIVESGAPPGVPPPGAVIAAVALAATQERRVAVQKPALKGRAVATKGADIISQDGIKAKYRKKCTVCGSKDVAVQTIIISNKTTNSGYYCPKCKKRRDVTIQCTSK